MSLQDIRDMFATAFEFAVHTIVFFVVCALVFGGFGLLIGFIAIAIQGKL